MTLEDLMNSMDIVDNPIYDGYIQNMLHSPHIRRLELMLYSPTCGVTVQHRLCVIDTLVHFNVPGALETNWHHMLMDGIGPAIKPKLKSVTNAQKDWLVKYPPSLKISEYKFPVVNRKRGLRDADIHGRLMTFDLATAVYVGCNIGRSLNKVRNDCSNLTSVLESQKDT